MKNRWFIAASAVGIHISIGSVYAYSAWKMPLENTFGWSATSTSLAFSIAIFFLGLSAAVLGRLIERHGPSKGGLLSAAFFSVGLFGSALAAYLESIWLFYLFFGVISGIGLGLGYISPVSTLVKWFPDRRGLATGLAIMGFGFGGLVCAHLIDVFNPAQAELVLPKELSAKEYVDLQSSNAAKVETMLAGVPSLADFKANESELTELQRQGQEESALYQSIQEANAPFKTVVLYDKSSIVIAFLALGVIYLIVMLPSALYITPPPADYAEKYFSGDNAVSKQNMVNVPEVTAFEALKTPGFYGLWIMLFINVACGIAVIATAKKMGYEMVRLSVEMSTLLVMGISLFNGLGRIMWASLSDYIGRSNTYVAFFLIQILAFPLLANLTTSPVLFMLVTFVILTCYGGGFASIPAYISDLFGLKEMPTIHGFILTAWSLAGIVGPLLNAYVYEQTKSYQQSLYVFGGAFVVALVVSLLMKLEIRRIQKPATEKARSVSYKGDVEQAFD
ncbi:OFA family MFS transporter [Gracilimonas mengyeensis]|uniref:Major Facilitator Superfamily protein n=1 Tax=Gracilimonas mengyeensis TaxID=1302730 RepID=A0A521C6W3_9BACT|nr:OFA family MFS transporter [Gracilimonas mengyeensis]SMO55154.1 Major Facilitator Superfamily protein [Gracilimonas mengyeensis]